MPLTSDISQVRMRSMRLGAATLLATMPAVASADSLATCTVSASAVSFGVYNPMQDATSVGTVSTSCSLVLGISLLVAYTIGLGSGAGSYGQRTLLSGSDALRYNLYTDSPMTQVWGDGTGGTSTRSDGYLLGLGGNARSYSVYGKIPAGQTLAAPGSYGDAIIVTITY